MLGCTPSSSVLGMPLCIVASNLLAGTPSGSCPEAAVLGGRTPEGAWEAERAGRSEALGELPQLAALLCCACTKDEIQGFKSKTV